MPSLAAQLKQFKNQNIYDTKGFITQDPDCIAMLKATDKLAPLDDAVLVVGESGTGKEIIAQRLHGRRTGRFIALNLSAMPDTMVQAELFGHVRGSYSGAVASRMGLLVAASKGTLFLDEIGDIAPDVQVMLLRLIETRLFRRIGENEDTKFTGRFVFASNSLGCNFRNDLYQRISTFRLDIKPLRRRIKDAELILKGILTDEETKDLLGLAWKNVKPEQGVLMGNVRELLRLAKQYRVLGRDYLDFR